MQKNPEVTVRMSRSHGEMHLLHSAHRAGKIGAKVLAIKLRNDKSDSPPPIANPYKTGSTSGFMRDQPSHRARRHCHYRLCPGLPEQSIVFGDVNDTRSQVFR